MLRLPEKMRGKLAKPYGKLYRGENVDLKDVIEAKNCRILACVGDLVSMGAIKASLNPQIIVIDGKTLRIENITFPLEGFLKIEAENPPATISCDLVRKLKEAVDLSLRGESVCVWVLGEEDLAVMPLGLLLPENSVILYGQPGEGVVALRIDREVKKLIKSIMADMEKVGECPELDDLIGGD